MLLPGGDEAIRPGDRIVVIGSPAAAQAWSALLAPGGRDRPRRRDLRRRTGRLGDRPRAPRPGHSRAADRGVAARRRASVAEALPQARVYNATGVDPDFLERERIGHANAAIFAMRDDAKNLYAASLAEVHGVQFTIGIAHEPVSAAAFEHAGIDVSVNPRAVTAEEIIRFAHDPRTQQVALLEGNRYEVIDVTLARQRASTSASGSRRCRSEAR